MTHCVKLLKSGLLGRGGGRLLSTSPTFPGLLGARCLSGQDGLLTRLWGRDSNTGSDQTGRWRMLAPAMLTHLSLGAPYGWSALSGEINN